MPVIKGIKPVTCQFKDSLTSRLGLPDHQLLWLQTGAAGSISDSPSGVHFPGSILERETGKHDVCYANTTQPQNETTVYSSLLKFLYFSL